MPLDAPNLDDRTFEDLLREARLRIPRYCREWTDFNEGDPGTALVQLFAWFTELMLYRLNQVPERNYIKFLELLNLQLRPAEPARAVVCLTATPGGKQVASLKSRARFEVTAGSETVFFETTHAIDLVPHPLDAIQVWDTSSYTDVTSLNDRGTGTFRPFGWNPQPGSSLYLGFKPNEGDQENPEAVFPERIYLRTFFPPEPNTPLRAGALVSASDERTLVWEYRSKLDAEATERWRPLAVLSDNTVAFTREGTIELRSPGSDIRATKVGKPTADNGPRFWIRCRFAQGQFPADRVPEFAFIRVNAVEVENLATFEDEVLGESDGFARDNDRAFRLRNTPVRPETVEIVLEGDTDVEPWLRVEDFLSSSSDSKHFTVSTTGVVHFGDGRRGRVPPPGSLVIARKYLAGGGIAGNLAAGTIANPPLGSSGIETVTNPRPATGGKAEESLEELKQRAPQALRGDGRAVTADDFSKFAERVAGVGKATVLERRHPDYPGFDIPGTVTVVVIPDTMPRVEEGVAPRPLPSQDLLDRVSRELNKLRTVGTEVFVTAPRYTSIEVRVKVVPAENVSDAEAKEGVKRAIRDFLSPLPRPVAKPATTVTGAPLVPTRKKPASRYPNGWPFGEPFYPGQLFEVILSASDDKGTRYVRNVSYVELKVDGNDWQLGNTVRFDEQRDTLPACTAEVEIENARSGGRP